MNLSPSDKAEQEKFNNEMNKPLNGFEHVILSVSMAKSYLKEGRTEVALKCLEDAEMWLNEIETS